MAKGNLCHDLMALYFWAVYVCHGQLTINPLAFAVESSAKGLDYPGGDHLLMKDDIIEMDTNATMTPITIPALGTPSSDSLAMTMLERKRLYEDNNYTLYATLTC